MNFSENTNLLPGGQSASPSKVKELENRIDDLAQTVTNVADSVAGLSNEVNTAELNATSANVTNAVIDNATVGTETATTVNATTANADTLNATDADITNLDADSIDANTVDADNGYFGSVNAQSFTGQGINITGDITASNKVQGKTVQATEKVVTPALESTTTELKGATTVRGDVYFPENGDKIYGEYLEVEAKKVKVKNLTTETPTGSSQLVGYDNNGNLIPVDAGLDPGNYWENIPNPDPEVVHFIKPKDDKAVQAPVIWGQYIVGEQKIEGAEIAANDLRATDSLTIDVGGETYLKNTEVDGTLTVKGDIIQNGSAYETHAEKLYTKKDIIITRDGAVSGLSTGEYTGIQATKYDGTNDGQLVFDKDGEARVGDVGDTQPLLTRDEVADLTDGNPLVWDATNKKAITALSVITASSTTLTGAPISSGSVIRVMFTSAITGSDTTTALSLSYNGTSYSVKVGKNGVLSNFVASYVNNDYTYLQAYTALELAFDGTQFIIIGNPVVLSSSDYAIYADGSIVNRPQAKVIHLAVRNFSITPSVNYIALNQIEASLTNDYILVRLRGLWKDSGMDKYLSSNESLSNYPLDSGFFQSYIYPADTSDDWSNKAITLDFDAYFIKKSTMKEMTV